MTPNDDQPYNMNFTLKELEHALSTTESTSPGEDNILYEMIKHLPEHAKTFLLRILNKIWNASIFPADWKISLIIPAKKPNKDPNEATSYRPIALTSNICKLMEKMINTRLMWYLEKNKCLASVQYGFRKNRSTLDPLLRLSNHIQQGFVAHKQTIGVFFDMEKAYDRACRAVILEEFYKMGLRGNMMNFLREFLNDRYIKVKIGKYISKSFKQEEGVPQGSVLSVTCFSVAINKIVEKVSSPVKCSLFVDDFLMYVSSYDAIAACNYLQKSITEVTKWADENGFKFSTSKTVAVRFTRMRRIEAVPNLMINK